MKEAPFISICIPAYNRVHFLRRLLDSIAGQTFRDFEVILSDDSSSAVIAELEADYNFEIKYFLNNTALGTPENWNAAIRKASGKWIKLMHDDDWFSTPDALQEFADAAKRNPGKFLFSAYNNVSDDGRSELVSPEAWRMRYLATFPSLLIAKNFIGPPSVVMHPNDGRFDYDRRMKWLVDIDMYLRRLKSDRYFFIDKALINVGVGASQVTASVKANAAVEIPEHLLLIEKEGIKTLTNPVVYDYWWRFFRNFNIRNENQLREFGYTGNIPFIFQRIMSSQKKLPRKLLKFGPASKAMMYAHFLANRNDIQK